MDSARKHIAGNNIAIIFHKEDQLGRLYQIMGLYGTMANQGIVSFYDGKIMLTPMTSEYMARWEKSGYILSHFSSLGALVKALEPPRITFSFN